jgi:hypothetical protein
MAAEGKKIEGLNGAGFLKKRMLIFLLYSIHYSIYKSAIKYFPAKNSNHNSNQRKNIIAFMRNRYIICMW